MEEQDKYISALIELHRGLERQGPGDADYASDIISQLPALPANPRIADLGCGAGAGALLLAEKFQSRVRAVDFSKAFLDELEDHARRRGLEHLVETVECDMGNLDWEPQSIDLLWSEGAAYSITFDGALNAWRPLMALEGVAVISEMCYFTHNVPEPLAAFMRNCYPGIKTETENADVIKTCGFELLGTHRLPSRAWWDNYYGPLQNNIAKFKNSNDPVMQSVIGDTEEEMKIFKQYEAIYGYTFYVMKAA